MNLNLTVLPEIKDGAYVIHSDESKSIGTHWIALYLNHNNAIYFGGSFGVERILKEIKKFIGNKKIINIYRIEALDSIMCGYLHIGFIGFMLKGKSLLDYTNLFSSSEYEKNDKIILKYFH